MNIDPNKFDKIKKEAADFYKSIDEVYCPYLQEKVSFNAKGLDHIKFKEWNKARSIEDQYTRLRLLKLAPSILSKSHTLQELSETKKFERQKINSRWENRLVKIIYYGFVSVINGTRVKVIVKKIDNNGSFFWSIIPFWKPRKDNFGNQIKNLHEGDLEIQ